MDPFRSECGTPTSKVPPPIYEKQPPPYAEATFDTLQLAKLPTYEDFERQHESDDEYPTHLSVEGVVIADYNMVGMQHVERLDRPFDAMLSDKASFFYAFVLSLCLNWVGFLAAYTYSGSTAGRCGAMSGFGLSLIKMGILVRRASIPPEVDDVVLSAHGGAGATFDDRSRYMELFTCALIMLGCFIFARGTTAYLRYRRQLSLFFGPTHMM